jgi:NTP pyrophosphatase (non-canonical NTP hydrolase)
MGSPIQKQRFEQGRKGRAKLADVIQHLISLANEFNIDLEGSIKKKGIG